MILYVQKNEETSHLKIIHFYEEEDGVPSELEANAKSEISNLSILYCLIPDSTRRSIPGDNNRFSVSFLSPSAIWCI